MLAPVSNERRPSGQLKVIQGHSAATRRRRVTPSPQSSVITLPASSRARHVPSYDQSHSQLVIASTGQKVQAVSHPSLLSMQIRGGISMKPRPVNATGEAISFQLINHTINKSITIGSKALLEALLKCGHMSYLLRVAANARKLFITSTSLMLLNALTQR